MISCIRVESVIWAPDLAKTGAAVEGDGGKKCEQHGN